MYCVGVYVCDAYLVNTISRREACTGLILCVFLYCIEYKKPIVFGRG